ncbi:hypothetical protein M758_6G132000 [Ceratodon purpureus]|nr:hypothetical protein M758_6G132000 [Ceratodon purpureus]
MVAVSITALAISIVVSNAHTSSSHGIPVPGKSTIYSTYDGIAAPFPGKRTAPIRPTTRGPAGADDLLFQNLLSAEWAVFSFYQQGVEAFTSSNFTDAGFPNTTYSRITEICDNEAGHLLIFQDHISNHSIKPGACKYDFSFGNSPSTYLVLQTVLEVSSMAFLTGLVLQAKQQISKSALVAIGQVETRHLTWSLIDVWNVNPFSGPSDTVYPYANQILEVTNQFIIPGSCPAANPTYPSPRQNLPQLSQGTSNATLLPGSPITFTFRNASHVPSFKPHKRYYAVFFHSLLSISVPFDPATNSSTIPEEFELKGIVIAVIADRKGAPTLKSVLAGPLFILLQPSGLI